MQSIPRAMRSPGQLSSAVILIAMLGCSDGAPGAPRNGSTGSGSGGSGASTATGTGGRAGSTSGSGGSGGTTGGNAGNGGSGVSGAGGSGGSSATGGTGGMGTGGSGAGGSGTGGTGGSTTGGTGGSGTSGSGGAGGSVADAGPGGTGGSAGSGTDGGGSGGTGGTTPGDASPPDGGGSTLDPEISTIVTSVDGGRVSTGITTLSNFTTRNTCSDNTASGNAIGAARDWIASQFSTVGGLTVSKESFSYTGCGTGSTTVTDHNVLAVKLGTHADRVIVIGGHYDSRTINATSPTDRAPGANDSGSQTALVLEAARVMAGYTYDASIIFAAFAAEEQGLAGSAQLAKDYANYVVAGAKVEAMLNCDIVGGDTDANDATTLKQFRLFSAGTPREIMTPMGTTDDTSPSRGIMRYIGYWGARYVPSMAMLAQLREDRPSRGGDQSSFLDQSIPAVRFIETVESPNAGTSGSHQHTPDDLPMYVTPDYTARIAQVVIATAASLARAPAAPRSATIAGGTSASGQWTVNWMAPASGPAVDHYVIAARPSTENFYRTRVSVPGAMTSRQVTSSDLGLGSGDFYLSIAAVDAAGHESLFAYPEIKCSSTACQAPADALDVTAKK